MAIDEQLARIPDLAGGKMPGVEPKVAAKLFDELLAGGKKTTVELIDALSAVDDGSDYRVRFALHNMAKVVAADDRAAQRKVFVATLVGQLGGDRPATVQTFLVQQLQWIGVQTELGKLAALLATEDPALFDAALAAMTAQGESAAPLLRKAKSAANGERKAAIENALKQLHPGHVDKT